MNEEVETMMPVPLPPAALVEFPPEKVDLIRRTLCKEATDDELDVFLHVCKRTGLDPLLKQIYLVKRQGKMCVQVGIDGYRLVADRTGKYAGNDDPVFDDAAVADENLRPTWAKVTVYKVVDGIRCPFTATARWKQYAPEGNQAFMWHRMPHLMLGKCAEALALRKAFPAELSGVYTQEEMAAAEKQVITPDQIEVINRLVEEVQAKKIPHNHKKFLGMFGVTDGDLSDVPAFEYPTIVRMLKAKLGGDK